jgi:hypothetical protein
MNLDELETALKRLGLTDDMLAIGHAALDNMLVVIQLADGRWGTWFEERGNRNNPYYSDTEEGISYLALGNEGSSHLTSSGLPSLLTPGVDVDHPAVRALVPADYSPYGGMAETDWNARYWPTGDLDESGAPILAWPDADEFPDGFASAEGRDPIVLEPGTLIDHFGSQYTHITYPTDVLFPHRGLPASYLNNGYHRYQVIQQLPVWAGPTAPAFGQPGGGTQYYQLKPVIDLVSTGFLRKVEL